MTVFIRISHAVMILILTGTLFGSVIEQHINGQIPCAYCILQRSLMILVALCACMNLRFGIQIRYYGLMLLSALLGAAVSLTQISLHACPGFPEYGLPVFGLSLYTWAFLVFTCCIFSTGIFLCLYHPTQSVQQPLGLLNHLVFILLSFIIGTLIFLTYQQCGIGDCKERWDSEFFSFLLSTFLA